MRFLYIYILVTKALKYLDRERLLHLHAALWQHIFKCTLKKIPPWGDWNRITVYRECLGEVSGKGALPSSGYLVLDRAIFHVPFLCRSAGWRYSAVVDETAIVYCMSITLFVQRASEKEKPFVYLFSESPFLVCVAAFKELPFKKKVKYLIHVMRKTLVWLYWINKLKIKC